MPVLRTAGQLSPAARELRPAPPLKSVSTPAPSSGVLRCPSVVPGGGQGRASGANQTAHRDPRSKGPAAGAKARLAARHETKRRPWTPLHPLHSRLRNLYERSTPRGKRLLPIRSTVPISMAASLRQQFTQQPAGSQPRQLHTLPTFRDRLDASDEVHQDDAAEHWQLTAGSLGAGDSGSGAQPCLPTPLAPPLPSILTVAPCSSSQPSGISLCSATRLQPWYCQWSFWVPAASAFFGAAMCFAAVLSLTVAPNWVRSGGRVQAAAGPRPAGPHSTAQ